MAWRKARVALAASAAFVFLSLPLAAKADPPSRIGRLSELSGVVSFHTADQDQWSQATLNEPVTSGNAFWTEPNSRAEVRVGSTAIHMDQSTELDIDTLDDQNLVARIPQGAINLHVMRVVPGENFSIATPRGTVLVATPGTYHIDAGNDQVPTRIAVLAGAARIIDNNASLSLTAGEAATMSGGDPVSFDVSEAQPTPFDNSVLTRDRRAATPRAATRYVSPEMTGAEDLDNYGSWQTAPEYGAVWYPQAVPVGWEPYRYGHWQWVPPWGWTWVDDAPWGFAPFHYGRWAFIGGRWGWCPGTFVERPVFAPALVAFVGGANWSVAFATGAAPAIGWFPLAPHEVFVPSFPASETFIRNVNVTHVTNITNITNITNVSQVNFVNRQHVTVVPQTAFVSARSVRTAALQVPSNNLAGAQVAAAAPISPAIAEQAGRHEAAERARAVANAAPAGAPAPQTGAQPGIAKPQTVQAPTEPQPAKPAAPTAPSPPVAGSTPAPKPPTAAAEGAPQGRAKAPAAAAPGPPIAGSTPAPKPPTTTAEGTPQGQAKPPAAAAPGPPIAGSAPAPKPVPKPPTATAEGTAQGQAKPPAAAAPGPPIAHATPSTTPRPTTPSPQVATPAAPNAQSGRSAAAPPRQEPQHQANHVPAPPQRTAPPVVVHVPTNPPQAERQVQHPAQQTMLQPSQQGWTRNAPPQHAQPPQQVQQAPPQQHQGGQAQGGKRPPQPGQPQQN